MVDVTAPMSTFSGVVQCQTMVADCVRHLARLHARRREHLVTDVRAAGAVVRAGARRGRTARPAAAAPEHPDVRRHRLRPAAARRPARLARLRPMTTVVLPGAGHPVGSRAKGRDRLATSQLITTGLRKLYQPSHNRFYAVVVEVFCDQPGLPRAGSHDDIEVGFVMRRQRTSVTGAPGPTRRLARNCSWSWRRSSRRRSPEAEPPRGRPRPVVGRPRLARQRFEQDHRDADRSARSCESDDQGLVHRTKSAPARLDTRSPTRIRRRRGAAVPDVAAAAAGRGLRRRARPGRRGSA